MNFITIYSAKLTNFHKKLLHYISTRKIILFITFLYTTTVLVVLLHRFWQYEAFYYDHGMYESTAYQVSQFKLPLHDREYGKVPIYVDHLYPSMQVVLAPFYWIWNSYETPIIVMSLLVGLSVLVGYEIAVKLIRNMFMIYALLFAYMFYIGMQNALIFLIHEVTVGIFFLMALFWAVVNNRKKFFFILLLINLGFKETFSVTGVGVGLALFVYNNGWRKSSLITVIISVLYGLLAVKIIIPFFQTMSFGQAGSYIYYPEFTSDFFSYITRFFDTVQKRETILTSISTFGFLPLFSLPSIILVFQDFFQRFVLLGKGMSAFRQGLNLHYNASLSVLLFVGSVYSVSQLQKFRLYRKIISFHAALIIIFVTIYHQFIYRGPLGLIYNRDFFNITDNMKFMDEFVDKVPRKGKLMIQNNLAVRFTHNDLYLLLSEEHLRKVDPDVVVLDFRPGQNINNFWPMTEEKMSDLSKILLNDSRYFVLYNEPYRYIFVKKGYDGLENYSNSMAGS